MRTSLWLCGLCIAGLGWLGCAPTGGTGGNDNVIDNAPSNDNVDDNDNDTNDNETVPQGESLTASLDGDSEVPPVETSAAGAGTFTLNADRTVLTFQITADGLSGEVTAAHFHIGPPDETGDVVYNLLGFIEQSGTNVTINGTWDFTDTINVLDPEVALTTLLEDGFYVNLHTEANPTGEIRGQIIYPDDDE